MQFTSIHNQTHPFDRPLNAGICASYLTRLRGYMFHPPIQGDEALLFIQSSQNRIDAAIHMLFVGFDLSVFWLDNQKIVVDRCLARSWRPFYMPEKPAGYILEAHPSWLDSIQPGDRLVFQHA
jgi:uncharacterized membrane protein (UPF0127 family)